MIKRQIDTWPSKLKRIFITCFLPVSKNRKGECKNCGECCKLLLKCPFLKYNKTGKSYCRIFLIRPLGCRKYPRTESEWKTRETCGFKFNKH